MGKQQYHRIIVLFAATIVLLVTVVILIILSINKPKDIQINNYRGIDGKDGQSTQGIQGQQGIQGIQGIIGVQGISGKDGKNSDAIINNIVKEVPIKGDKGDAGLSSPQIHINVDYKTCMIQTWYDGDDTKQTIAQLPKPCEVSNDK